MRRRPAGSPRLRTSGPAPARPGARAPRPGEGAGAGAGEGRPVALTLRTPAGPVSRKGHLLAPGQAVGTRPDRYPQGVAPGPQRRHRFGAPGPLFPAWRLRSLFP